MKRKTVEVISLGKEGIKVEVGENDTIQDAMDKAGITANSVMVDGEDASFDDKIGSSEVITAIPKVKGGR